MNKFLARRMKNRSSQIEIIINRRLPFPVNRLWWHGNKYLLITMRKNSNPMLSRWAVVTLQITGIQVCQDSKTKKCRMSKRILIRLLISKIWLLLALASHLSTGVRKRMYRWIPAPSHPQSREIMPLEMRRTISTKSLVSCKECSSIRISQICGDG